MKLFPQCFQNVPGALRANIKHVRERFPVITLLTLIIIPSFSVIVLQTDYALVQYMQKLVADKKMSPDDADRTLAISRVGINILLVPWLLMSSYFPTIKRNLTVRNLIPELLENLKYMSYGWFYGIIRIAYTLFGMILLVCVAGFIIDESQNVYVTVATAIGFASLLVFSCSKIYLLLVFPYAASAFQTQNLKHYKIKTTEGLATYLGILVIMTGFGISTLFTTKTPEFPLKSEATLALAAFLFQLATIHICEMIANNCTIEDDLPPTLY